MDEYVECGRCEFVVLSAGTTTPEPQRVESCPGCESTDFHFPESERA